MAALLLVEIAMTSGFTPDLMNDEEAKCMRSMLYVTANYEGPSSTIQDLVSSLVYVKQAKSETQRVDLLQYWECFKYAADELRSSDPVWDGKPDIEVFNVVIANYNRSCRMAACKVDGAEKLAIQNLVEYGSEVKDIVAQCWNDYKVRDSPINQTLLAQNFLKKPLPVGTFPYWTSAMKPAKEKLPVLFNRICTAFTTKVLRAQAGQMGNINLRLSNSRFKESLTDDLFFATMCWAHWSPELKDRLSPTKWNDVNSMFMRGTLDDMIMRHMRTNDAEFKAWLCWVTWGGCFLF